MASDRMYSRSCSMEDNLQFSSIILVPKAVGPRLPQEKPGERKDSETGPLRTQEVRKEHPLQKTACSTHYPFSDLSLSTPLKHMSFSVKTKLL